jgi:flavodoxin
MKKGICILLSLFLLLFTAGCGNKDDGNGVENILQQTDGQEGQSTDYEQGGSGTEIQESSEAVSEPEQESDMETKILVVYFSATGTTKPLAEYVAEILNADLYEIVPEDPYTEEDLAYYTNGRADQEQNDSSARPAISGGVGNMEEYDAIFLGYPIWHGQAPRIISTFLESYDFSEKTIIPFCTSHSSGIGSSADNLHSLCSDSTEWLEGKRFAGETSRGTIEEWLSDTGLSK